MTSFSLEPAANFRLDEIADYSRAQWGDAQAEAYIEAMFEEFAAIADRRVVWHRIAPEVGIDGYFRRWRSHYIYWKSVGEADIVIVAILHARMHRSARLREALGNES